MNRGFTLIELVISIAIFASMTALVVVKYGTFNESTLLTDTAYDMALAVHTAQSYGLSVKNASAGFNSAYGIDFSMASGGNTCGSSASNATNIVLFADTAADGLCASGDADVTTYAITRGAYVSGLCAGTGSGTPPDCDEVADLDISYLRPNPEANICGDGSCDGAAYAEIELTGRDGGVRAITVRQNGQISVRQQ